VQTATAYLETLNPEQRQAVEHGAAGGLPGAPLLVIAGAGSGKTNTLAHRVAHLIVQGADPRRILLMTFSRRAASEMARRVERIARKVLGDNAGVMTDALTWAGTFHGIGARLLREYAEQIGVNPAFTIHDREDSADLMNLVRHEKGFSKTESRFPTKGTCLSIYSRCVNAETPIEQVIGTSYPWCSGWAAELKELFASYVEAKQKHNVSITTISCSTGRRWSATPAWPTTSADVSITCWSTNIRTPTACNPRSCWRSSPAAAG